MLHMSPFEDKNTYLKKFDTSHPSKGFSTNTTGVKHLMSWSSSEITDISVKCQTSVTFRKVSVVAVFCFALEWHKKQQTNEQKKERKSLGLLLMITFYNKK